MSRLTRLWIGTLALGMLVVVCSFETAASTPDDPLIRDHRTSVDDEFGKIKLPPVEGPTVQWHLLSVPVFYADRPGMPPAPRYRLMAISLQLTTNPTNLYLPLQLRPLDAPGMRANVAYHRNGTTNDLELNQPFAMYLVDQRAYVIHRPRSGSRGVSPRMTLDPSSVNLPSDLGIYEWDPSRKGARARPSSIFQWQLRVTGDRRTRSIATRRASISAQLYDVTERLALFNTSANAYLILDFKDRVAGWRDK
jgi:hypothetical protein